MERKEGHSSARYLVYGALAAMTARTVTAPLERAKVLQQAAMAGKLLPLGLSRGSSRSLLGTLGFMWRSPEPLVRSLWKGNLLNATRVVPGSAFRFFAFDGFQRLLYPSATPPATAGARIRKRLVCSSLAASSSAVLTYPLDFARLRWTVQTPHLATHGLHYGASLLQMFRSIAAEEGPVVFFRGCLLSIAGLVPYVTANFTLYGTLRERLCQHNLALGRPEQLSTPQALALGGLSGAAAMTLVFPLDPVHTRLIVEGYRTKTSAPSVGGVVKAMWREEGFRGFSRGLWPSYLKVVPSQAINWAVIELCARYIG